MLFEEGEGLDVVGVGELVDRLEGFEAVVRGEVGDVLGLGEGVAGDVEEFFGKEVFEVGEGGGIEPCARRVDDHSGRMLGEGGKDLPDIAGMESDVCNGVARAVGSGIGGGGAIELNRVDSSDFLSKGKRESSRSGIEVVKNIRGI